MKIILAIGAVLVASSAIAAETPRWEESVQVFFTLADVDDGTIIEAVDKALTTTGFRRNSTGTRYPSSAAPGIFASYTGGQRSAAMLVEASRTGCMVFSATNYDKSSEGLAGRAGTAVKTRLLSSYRSKLRFYSDAYCKSAL